MPNMYMTAFSKNLTVHVKANFFSTIYENIWKDCLNSLFVGFFQVIQWLILHFVVDVYADPSVSSPIFSSDQMYRSRSFGNNCTEKDIIIYFGLISNILKMKLTLDNALANISASSFLAWSTALISLRVRLEFTSGSIAGKILLAILSTIFNLYSLVNAICQSRPWTLVQKYLLLTLLFVSTFVWLATIRGRSTLVST